ncbi:interferon-induced GTP-binding protein Mx2-like [Eleutherodactylus coqui]|uniref:interferon-induced GTP-binding protein Mx2-like n=1 Tax=Eleutherodactylus coqui TaxID=57060 RepID=UPI0034625C36
MPLQSSWMLSDNIYLLDPPLMMAKQSQKKMPIFGRGEINQVDFSRFSLTPSNMGSAQQQALPFPLPKVPAPVLRSSENMNPAGRHPIFNQGFDSPVPSSQHPAHTDTGSAQYQASPFSLPKVPAHVQGSSENVISAGVHSFFNQVPSPQHPDHTDTGSAQYQASPFSLSNVPGSAESINPAGRHSLSNPGFDSPVPSPQHPDHTDTPEAVKLMDKQFQEKIRPCIDLIDSLRSLGVEKDLALPAIAVIGDQSSGKSSVLEALSGVTLPRGTGIVTRCPLELKMKKCATNSPWSGTISYRSTKITVQGPSAVENEVRKAQDYVAGAGKGISAELITLEIVSPNVPDLTLIDLPGITRIALPNQPQDIGNQIKQIIRNYITRQETINLAVVPCNVDIATTEVLEMAREVDPTGERTIGVLTKPDLIDVGAEAEVVHVVQNRVYSLKKGYMMVKCRGQMEIQNKTPLEEAMHNEKAFFENHKQFRVLLNRGQATIPHLAERLTKELVYHISKTLPNIDQQIRSKLREAEEQLSQIGRGVPDTEEEQTHFLVSKIRDFDDGIMKVVNGDEEGKSEDLKLFKNLRKLFESWEMEIKNSCVKFVNEMREESDVYENQYRGRELIGFINYKKFENIMRQHIVTFQDPAIRLLHAVTELIQKCFLDVVSKCFGQFCGLSEAATDNIDDISHKQEEEAGSLITLQFKMERIIHCQDTRYCEVLSVVRAAEAGIVRDQKRLSMNDLACHLEAYLQNTTSRLSNQVPLIIQHFMLYEFKDHLQYQMIRLLEERNKTDLLEERDGLSGERQKLKDQIQRLRLARERLQKF